MPLYEYVCQKCERRFDVLVRNKRSKTACPSCKSKKSERLFSIFSTGSQSTTNGAQAKSCGAGG